MRRQQMVADLSFESHLTKNSVETKNIYTNLIINFIYILLLTYWAGIMTREPGWALDKTPGGKVTWDCCPAVPPDDISTLFACVGCCDT